MEQQLGAAAKDIVMTEGERLIARGREQERRDVLLSLLRRRFGEQEVAGEVERKVMAASMTQLGHWMARIPVAGDLRDALDAGRDAPRDDATGVEAG